MRHMSARAQVPTVLGFDGEDPGTGDLQGDARSNPNARSPFRLWHAAGCGKGLGMSGHAAAIFRHPIKGFTPEALPSVQLAPGEGFPFDRLYAVENGPSGFDPAEPAFVPKQKFTVLAQIPKVRRRADPLRRRHRPTARRRAGRRRLSWATCAPTPAARPSPPG